MKKCGDCIHADACEHNQNIPLFNSANEAYCKGFKDRTKYVEVVRCKDCKHRGEEGCCPMYFVDEIEWDDDGYIEVDYVPHDYTVDDGFCDRGERRTNV